MSWWQRFLAWFHPAPAPPVGPIEPFSESELVRRHNAERAAHGLQPLVSDSRLAVRAQVRASNAAELELTRDHLHDGFTMSPGDSRDGENAEIGSPDAASVMAVWMDSPGHRVNILDPRFKRIGCGRGISRDGKCYWYVAFSG